MRVKATWAAVVACMLVVIYASVPFGMAQSAASDGSIRGVVRDENGKPLRGALVSASVGPKTVSRFTDKDGQYVLGGLRPGNYEVTASAWTYGSQSQASATNGAELSFKLQPEWEVDQLSTAEWLTYLPANNDTRLLEAACTGCHNFEKPAEKRGMTAEGWKALIKTMTMGKMFNPGYSDAQLVRITAALDKYFGPSATMPKPEQVKHVDVSDEALNATFYEFKMPNIGFVHSITVDEKGVGWITEYDHRNNKMAKFDFDTETFTEYPLPFKKALPHTPVVAKDGRIWTPMNDVNKLIVQDPNTGAIRSYDMPVDPAYTIGSTSGGRQAGIAGGHTGAFDSKGKVWISATGYNKILAFDPKSEEFSSFDVPVPETIPAESNQAYLRPPDAPKPSKILAASYDIAVDSKDTVWYTQLSLGIIVNFDPATGKSKTYKAPGVPSSRGIAIDSQDNVWFSNFNGHKLMKLDRKTDKITAYEAPTKFASPYGIVLDREGNVWYADSIGNNMTKFDPKTGRFVEYPIPTKGATPRFFGIDPKGRIWFTESFRDRIGILDPGGATTKNVSSAAR